MTGRVIVGGVGNKVPKDGGSGVACRLKNPTGGPGSSVVSSSKCSSASSKTSSPVEDFDSVLVLRGPELPLLDGGLAEKVPRRGAVVSGSSRYAKQ